MPRSAAGGSSSMARPTQTYPHPPPGQPSPEELTLFTTLSAYADALDALPLDLTRSFSDLRELDAVLGAHLNSLTNRLIHLAALIENPNVSPGERIVALKEVAEEARSYKMGGEDKIRVALNTAETVRRNQIEGSWCTACSLSPSSTSPDHLAHDLYRHTSGQFRFSPFVGSSAQPSITVSRCRPLVGWHAFSTRLWPWR
jgi:hypothetical protein